MVWKVEVRRTGLHEIYSYMIPLLPPSPHPFFLPTSALFDMVHGLRYISIDVTGNFTIAELFYRSGGIPWEFPANLVNASDITFSFFPHPGG